MSENINNKAGSGAVFSQIAKALEDFLSEIPDTDEPVCETPELRAREIINRAAVKAALVSGSLALPLGPAGMVTIIPDLLVIWRLQGRMIVDISSTYGKKVSLTREQMLFCLFKHAAAQAFRDVVIRIGERYLVKQTSLRVIQQIIHRIAPKITQRVLGKAISRWLPLVGSAAVGVYAYRDTVEVGKTAVELFSSEIQIQGETAELWM